MFVGGYHPMGEPDELSPLRNGNVRTPWWRSKLFRIFCISVTMTGFLVSLTSALHCLLEKHCEYIYFLISGVVCLTVSVHCMTSDWSPLHQSRSSSMPSLQAIPIRVTTGDNLKTLLRRSNSEGMQGAGPDRSPSTLSLPTYILVPMEQQLEREDLSSASTESTLIAESGPEEFTTAPTSQNVSRESLPTAGMTEAAVVISQIVDESLGDKRVGAASENNTDGSKSETDQEGVRQRKITPMEPQQYIPLPEGGNVEPPV